MKAIHSRDHKRLSGIVCDVASNLKTRCETLLFPEKEAKQSPHRSYLVAVTYLDEVGTKLPGNDDRVSADELAWHAFAAVVGVAAGVLDHLENEQNVS